MLILSYFYTCDFNISYSEEDDPQMKNLDDFIDKIKFYEQISDGNNMLTFSDFLQMPIILFEKMISKQYDLKKKEYDMLKDKKNNTKTYQR